MKAATIPYPREFGPGASGIDCRAVKRALAVALKGPHGMALKTNLFARTAQKCLVEFKHRHGLVPDPLYTIQAHEKLQPSFDEYGATLMSKAKASIAAQRQRDTLVTTFEWMIAHKPFYYAEVRPIPEHLPPFQVPAGKIRTDCSGSVELAACWSKLPDPSRLGYDGAGNTSTLLHACTHIPSGSALPGDLIVYRKGSWDGYGHHVVAILKVIGAHQDFVVFSNGYVGDPLQHTHSQVQADQDRYGAVLATFLRFLPVP